MFSYAQKVFDKSSQPILSLVSISVYHNGDDISIADLAIANMSLVSSILTFVTMKLDDLDYLHWHFHMQLLLEGYGIVSLWMILLFILNDFLIPTLVILRLILKDHLLGVNLRLSHDIISCAIGSTSSQDLWNRLKEKFSTITRINIFQMKSELQMIKKGNNSINVYLQRIKEAMDYLSAAGECFDDDDDIVSL